MKRSAGGPRTESRLADDAAVIFERYVRTEGLKSSRVRLDLVRTIASTRGHFTAEALLQRLSRRGKVSKATLYRTLAMMQDCQLLVSHDFGGGALYFESALDQPHHDHLYCLGCGAIAEFTSRGIEALQARVAADVGFELTAHSHKLYGYCARCVDQRKTRPASTGVGGRLG
jgi:Fur family ferric uptake transcriptional regulator